MRSFALMSFAVASGVASAFSIDGSAKAAADSRRSFLASTAAAAGSAAFLLPTLPANAMDYDLIEDATNGFQIKVPQGWDRSVNSLPDRRKIEFYIDPATNKSPNDKTLVFLAYTPVRDDFTSLGSFGSVDEVAQSTILPKGIIMGEDTKSKMLSAESKKNAYMFDYTAKVPGQPERHFRTIFALAQGATGGAGANLVTITAQCSEDRYATMKPVFDAVIDSYGKVGSK